MPPNILLERDIKLSNATSAVPWERSTSWLGTARPWYLWKSAAAGRTTSAAPLESIGFAKQKKLSLVAAFYLSRHGLYEIKARFDVVAVKLRPPHPEVELVRDAFDLIT
ncbi:MAG: hypothetical protein QG555_1298 [Thermodesulfobacteriota bacterium]|nr:hypothetical protein [Thermodesulfobacteriota bacterium]